MGTEEARTETASDLVRAARGGSEDAAKRLCERVAPANFDTFIELVYPSGMVPGVAFDRLCDVYDEWRAKARTPEDKDGP